MGEGRGNLSYEYGLRRRTASPSRNNGHSLCTFKYFEVGILCGAQTFRGREVCWFRKLTSVSEAFCRYNTHNSTHLKAVVLPLSRRRRGYHVCRRAEKRARSQRSELSILIRSIDIGGDRRHYHTGAFLTEFQTSVSGNAYTPYNNSTNSIGCSRQVFVSARAADRNNTVRAVVEVESNEPNIKNTTIPHKARERIPEMLELASARLEGCGCGGNASCYARQHKNVTLTSLGTGRFNSNSASLNSGKGGIEAQPFRFAAYRGIPDVQHFAAEWAVLIERAPGLRWGERKRWLSNCCNFGFFGDQKVRKKEHPKPDSNR